MEQTTRQEQIQTQKQILSPRMIQSMEILQLPILALQERIDQELLDNPTLESVDSYDSSDNYDDFDHSEQSDQTNFSADSESQPESANSLSDIELAKTDNASSGENNLSDAANAESEIAVNEKENADQAESFRSDDYNAETATTDHDYEEHNSDEQELVIHENGGQDDFERLNNLGDEYSTDFSSDSSDYYSGLDERSSGRNSDEASEIYNTMLANMVAKPETLQDHLIQQLSWYDLSKEEYQACEKIIYNLDERGFFVSSLDDLFPNSDLSMEEMQRRALETVQKLEPRGVGARDIRECLLLQLNPEQKYYLELKKLIENYLTDLEYNRLPQISKATGYSFDFLQTLICELRVFNPAPGRAFQHSVVPLLVPDVHVIPNSEGGYTVTLEDQEVPQLKISSLYKKLETSRKSTTEEKEYIHRKLNSAQWLIDSIAQRNDTILRVCQAIFDYQKDFLDNGPEYLKPLRMQQIASVLKIDISTVSRAVDEKWAQTPRGIFPLRKFFMGGVPATADSGNDDEDGIAWTVVQGKIREMVDNEDKSAPLSDDTIMERLAADGINIARRTIAKYRKILNIPSSRQRRDWALAAKKDQ